MNEIEKIKEKKMKEMMNKPNEVEIEVSDNDFQERVLNKSKDVPMVVDFWAPWCMPCQILGPTLSKVAKDYDGKFVLAKINVDQSPGMSQQFGVRSIPSVKLIKDGRVVDEFVGALPEDGIKQWIDKNLGE